MNQITHQKKEAMFFKTISVILHEINNTNISQVTCQGVRLSSDSHHLVVFVAFAQSAQKSLAHLNKIKGFVRKRLAQSIKIRKVPDVVFKLDKTFEKAQKIEAILAKIRS